jgi:hypothetical protein
MPRGYSLRTKPTVEDGVTHVESTMDFNLIEYQPGNCTRYVVLISNIGERLSERSLNLLGTSKGSVMVQLLSNLSNPRMMTIGNGDWIDPYWVQDQLKVSMSDAVVLGELIGHMLNYPHMTCEQFEKS